MSENLGSDEFAAAAALVEDVLAQRLSPEKALELWPASSDKLLAKAWTRLRHFADDADIHRTDHAYLVAEQGRLRDCVVELKRFQKE